MSQYYSVQLKKKDGRLSLTPAAIVFAANNSAADSVSVPTARVKSQAANVVSEKNPRVVLKITLVDGEALNFVFVGQGAEASRTLFSNSLKAALAMKQQQQQQVSDSRPNSASSGSITAHDIQIRQALLMNPKYKDLAQLHRDLVIGQIISEHDFWLSRKELLVNQDWVSGMKKGQSSASLVDVVRAAAGSSSNSSGSGDNEVEKQDPSQPTTTTVKFTPEIIHSIFVQSPAVQVAYEKYVPEKMSEREFWTKYYTSKAFHALKAGKSSSGDRSEIFSEGEAEIEDDLLPIPKKLKKDPTNKLLDLSATMEDHLDYGNAPDTTMKPGSFRNALPIIRRLNRHSTIVLKSAGDAVVSQPTKFYEQETVLEDLMPPQKLETRELRILQASSYFGGVVDGSAGKEGVNSAGLVSASLNGWQPKLMTVAVNPVVGGKVYAALNRASLKRKVVIPTCKETLNRSIRDDIHQIQNSASELLRHYWAFKQKAESATGEAAVMIAGKLEKLRVAIVNVYSHIVQFQQSFEGGEDAKLLEGIKIAMAYVSQ
ncbi:hypothetical protein BDR26DRAFT_865620 [Obelidium mucronatum]|nr:hypothetical protein BDR26DRAFT_865620 [Obelidium mucronatum]